MRSRAFRSQTYDVLGSGSSPAGCISIRVTATLSVMNNSLPLQSSRSMFGVLFWIRGFGYGYDYIIIMIIVFTYLGR
jgi:hypothetical protein